LGERDRRNRPIIDDNFLMLLNAHHEEIPFTLPQFHYGAKWETLIDTVFEDGIRKEGQFAGGDKYPLQGRSSALLRLKAHLI